MSNAIEDDRMREIEELRERIGKAVRGDRELDVGLANALTGLDVKYPFVEGSAWDELTPHFTSSVDAALALVERKLPGWKWTVDGGADRRAAAYLWCEERDTEVTTASTPPLAILTALLEALSQEKEPGRT